MYTYTCIPPSLGSTILTYYLLHHQLYYNSTYITLLLILIHIRVLYSNVSLILAGVANHVRSMSLQSACNYCPPPPTNTLTHPLFSTPLQPNWASSMRNPCSSSRWCPTTLWCHRKSHPLLQRHHLRPWSAPTTPTNTSLIKGGEEWRI